MEENKIVIYQTEDGQTQIDVRLENETVWLTQAQMAQLFQTDRTSIVRHINNIYKVEELDRDSTCAKIAQVQIEGKRTVKRNIPFFNLDMIISVGDRVNSKRGVKFRQWANRVLKDYLVKGYAINQRIHREQIGELRQLVSMLGRTIQSQPLLSTDESNALFEVVTDYTYALDTLDNYDYERLTIDKTTKESPYYLQPIIEAMKENRVLNITYHSYWKDEENNFDVQPYCVKLFRQRWYMVARSTYSYYYEKGSRVYALDRIKHIPATDETFEMPKDWTAEKFFDGCFGIVAEQSITIQPVKLKVSAGKANYFRDLRLHESQEETERNEEYSIFTLNIRPEYDFLQELLWNGEDVEVLEPLWLRKEIAGRIKRMWNKYKDDQKCKILRQ